MPNDHKVFAHFSLSRISNIRSKIISIYENHVHVLYIRKLIISPLKLQSIVPISQSIEFLFHLAENSSSLDSENSLLISFLK